MPSMRTHGLPLPDVNLYYETRGSGPILLLIAGGTTDADIFADMADVLAGGYTVITYDPRGNSRSPLAGPAADILIPQLADDAHALLQAVSDGPALVFGSSSGAITGLDLLTRYPGAVARLVAHEPPMFQVLPDASHWDEQLESATRAYRQGGVMAGMARFAALMGFGDPAEAQEGEVERSGQAGTQQAAESAENNEFQARMSRNAELFMAHEVLSFTRYQPDLKTLRARAGQLVLAVGAESSTLPPALPAKLLAKEFGLPLAQYPGNHVGYAIYPKEFARQLQKQLSVR